MHYTRVYYWVSSWRGNRIGLASLNSRGKTGLVCYYNVITMSPPLSKLQFCGILSLLSDVLNATGVGIETTA